MNVDDHNSLLRRATRRADDLEERMEAVLVPILDRWAGRAADAFQTRATGFLRAAASLAAAAPSPSSTMIACYPRPEEAEALAQADGEPADILHVTLCYLGDTDEDAVRELVQVLGGAAGAHAPLEGIVAGIGVFADGEDGTPALALPSVPGLVELRAEVAARLQAAGWPYSREYGWIPHMTIAYGVGAPPPSALIGMPLHFDQLVIARGDVRTDLPLVGRPPLTAATPAWAPPFPNELIDIDALIAELRTKTDPVRLAVIATMMTEALGRVGLSFDVTNPFTARVLAQSGSQIVNIAETTRLNVMRIVRASLDEGLSIPDTAKAIRAGMREASPARARLIARTEIVGATNGGSLAATRIVQSVTGERLFKKWLTAPYAKNPRHSTYMGLHGQTRKLDEAFQVGGSSMDHPGDSAGPPHEVCNCRCALVYTDEDEGAEEAGPPKTAGQLADRILEQARFAEVRVSDDLLGAARTQVNGELAGFAFRLKGKESLERKIAANAAEQDIALAQAADEIGDALRYTILLTEKAYASGVRDVLAMLERQGYVVEKFRNYWTGRGYSGVNANLRYGDQMFELQFHTDASLQVKEKISHPLYERMRVETDPARREALSQQIAEAWDAVVTPRGAKSLP